MYMKLMGFIGDGRQGLYSCEQMCGALCIKISLLQKGSVEFQRFRYDRTFARLPEGTLCQNTRDVPDPRIARRRQSVVVTFMPHDVAPHASYLNEKYLHTLILPTEH